MADPFVSEIRIFPFNFAPRGWAKCDGQLLSISQNTALFALLGTAFGGDGKSTFGLPDLRDRVPVDSGQGESYYDLGQTAGEPYVTLIQSEMAAHGHSLGAVSDQATAREPQDQLFATGDGVSYYDTQSPTTTLDPRAVTVAGGSLPHNNMMPYVTFNFCLAMQGVFPPRG